jgi:hypothetical protein
MASLNTSRRGQLFLIGAVGLALTFIFITVLLNSAIYAENVSVRSDVVYADEGTQSLYDTRNSLENVMERLNAESPGTTGAEYETAVRTWSQTYQERQTGNGRLVNIEPLSTTAGERLFQSSSGTFESAGGASTWQIVESTPSVRQFRLTVDAASLDASTDFRASVSEGFTQYSTVTFTRPFPGSFPNTVYAYVDTPSGPDGYCLATNASGRVTFDLTAGTAEGSDCQLFDGFFDKPSSQRLWFAAGDEATGTYTLTVPNSATIGSEVSPEREAQLYSAELELTYVSTTVSYTERIRIADGERTA